MKTVGDIVQLIISNTQSENAELAKHAKTLLGPRTRGSTTEFGLEAMPASHRLDKARPGNTDCVADGCVLYLIGDARRLNGQVKAVPLSQAFVRNLDVQIRDGEHGSELFVDADDCEGIPTNIISVIVGEFAGERAVFTWHPGPPMSPLSEGVKRTTAVKLHNN